MKCDDCGGPAKPLLFGKFCVNECDRNNDEGTKDEPDEPTNPGYVIRFFPACRHINTYHATHGNVTGTWCMACGRHITDGP